MKVGILGTGDVGQALGKGFAALGHEVRLGAREAGNEKGRAWAAEVGGKATSGTFAEAVEAADLVVLATFGTANESALRMAGVDRLRGKVVIDTTNPLAFAPGKLPQLAVSGEDSAGERVQRLLPDSFVVKAWNTVGSAHMFRPDFPGGPPDMFICGEDAAAKATVTSLLADFGWGVVDAGGIASSRYLEAMCLVWVLTAISGGNWNQAFKLLRK